MSTELTTTQNQSFPLFGDLPLRHNLFVTHYLANDGNGTLAARLAGYPGDEAQLAVTASRLIRNVKVKLEIERRLGKSIASSDEVLERLTQHARGDLTDVLKPDGSFDLRYARARGSSKLLKKLKVKRSIDKDGTEHVDHEYEIHDPQAALEKLGRFHKLFADRTESELVIDPQRLAASMCELLTVVRDAVLAHRASESAQLGVSGSSGDELSQSSSQVIDVTAEGDSENGP